jgi:quinoprotein dehydrogenase-associated probable ABC transporter substrate-binding protein
MKHAHSASFAVAAVLACLPVLAQDPGSERVATSPLRVCADPDNMPQSDRNGGGYENKIAEQLARDLNRKLEYFYFPQRMGFVRNTLRARDEATQQFKCDLIVGVPKGYELTATTKPYMRSTYAIVAPARPEFKQLREAADLLKLPKAQQQKLRYGIFARSPASDWLLRNGLLDRAMIYPVQSGDPKEHPANIIERDLAAGKIDLAIVWGPVAGFLTKGHAGEGEWISVPFKPDPTIKFDYEISMGVRFGEKEWKDTVEKWIAEHDADIERILTDYRIPLLDESAGPSLGSRPDDD